MAAVTFQAKLGSYGDKVERMRTLARWIAEQWFASSIPQASVASADRAAELASAIWSPTWSVSSPNCKDRRGPVRKSSRRT